MNRQIALRSAIGAAMLLGTAGAAFPWHAWKTSGLLTSGVLGYYYKATYTTLYSFTATSDGGQPKSGLLAGPGGTTFGTTTGPGSAFVTLPTASGSNPWTVDPIAVLANGASYPLTAVSSTELVGVEPNDVFTLTYDGTSFTKTVIFAFPGGNGGTAPTSAITVGAGGSFLGTASGGSNGGGIVYSLTAVRNHYREAVLYAFTTGGATGDTPSSKLAIGKITNRIYGTTSHGGANGLGTLFALAPSGHSIVAKVLHNFAGGTDGANPSGLLEDANYNLYGVTTGGGAGSGTVYEYSFVGGGKYSQLYTFVNGADGAAPAADLSIDAGGALYGTAQGGIGGQGTAFVLEPPTSRHGSWTMDVLHAFSGTTKTAPASGTDGAAPAGGLLLDSYGNIYGTTTYGGAYGWGSVYKLTPGGY